MLLLGQSSSNVAAHQNYLYSMRLKTSITSIIVCQDKYWTIRAMLQAKQDLEWRYLKSLNKATWGWRIVWLQAIPFFIGLMVLELLVGVLKTGATLVTISDGITSISAGMISRLPMWVCGHSILDGMNILVCQSVFLWVGVGFRD